MREIRQSGSEGGVAFGPSLPLSWAVGPRTVPVRSCIEWAQEPENSKAAEHAGSPAVMARVIPRR